MKISKWKELDGVDSGKYSITAGADSFCIFWEKEDLFILKVFTARVPKEKTLEILKLFGFDIEFEEPPKLSKRAWHLVNYLPKEYWLAKDKDCNKIYCYYSKPTLDVDEKWWFGDNVNFDNFNTVDDSLLPFIKPDRAWSVKELRELEVEDEI